MPPITPLPKLSFLTLPFRFNRCSKVRLGLMRCSRTIGNTMIARTDAVGKQAGIGAQHLAQMGQAGHRGGPCGGAV
jgi:hypothetical protein